MLIFSLLSFLESCIADKGDFLNLSRSDLKDLFPNNEEFPLRRKIWNTIEENVSFNLKYFWGGEGKTTGNAC